MIFATHNPNMGMGSKMPADKFSMVDLKRKQNIKIGPEL